MWFRKRATIWCRLDDFRISTVVWTLKENYSIRWVFKGTFLLLKLKFAHVTVAAVQGTLPISDSQGGTSQKSKDRRIFLFEQSVIIADHIPPKKEFGNPIYIFKNQIMVRSSRTIERKKLNFSSSKLNISRWTRCCSSRRSPTIRWSSSSAALIRHNRQHSSPPRRRKKRRCFALITYWTASARACLYGENLSHIWVILY